MISVFFFFTFDHCFMDLNAKGIIDLLCSIPFNFCTLLVIFCFVLYSARFVILLICVIFLFILLNFFFFKECDMFFLIIIIYKRWLPIL